MGTGWVVVEAGVARADLPEGFGPAQLLRERPTGVYTTALVAPDGSVVDWDLHVERLTRNIEAMSTEHDPSSFSWLNIAQAGKPIKVDSAIIGREASQSASVAISMFHRQAAAEDRYMMVTVLLEDNKLDSCSNMHCVGSQESNSESLKVIAIAGAYTAPDPHAPVSVGVMGPPRQLPQVKRAQWARDRQPLEARKTAEMSEVILSDEEGGLLEGLITNLCAVYSGHDGHPRLVTAPTKSVLPGILRHRLLEACQLLDIEVELRPPKLSEFDCWEECFVTRNQDGKRWMLAKAPGPVTRKLQEKVQELQQLTPFHQLSAR